MAPLEDYRIKLIAFFEYCLMVPANRYGFANGFSGYQLKMIQEVITLVVFCTFATFILKEPLHLRCLVSFALLLGAVYFMFKNNLCHPVAVNSCPNEKRGMYKHPRLTHENNCSYFFCLSSVSWSSAPSVVTF